MPKGAQGQKRPGDVIGAAVMVAKIATGELYGAHAPECSGKDPSAVALGSKGGRARAKKLTREERSDIARVAASSRLKSQN